MHISAIAGLFSCAVIFTVMNSSPVSAAPSDLLETKESQQPITEVLLASAEPKEAVAPVTTPVPAVISHDIKPGESLSKISTQYQTTWKRLFDKNATIADPDIISAGQKIVIPAADEVLQERPVPQPVQPVAVTNTVAPTQKATSGPKAKQQTQVARGSSAGNTYTAGYCTWYVKNMRPGLPNNLGNANTWVSRAAAQGMATGSTPQVGAVGQRGMHVVYVEAVNPDGTVTISEMNHKGLYVKTVRTLPASYFTYIY